MSTPPRLAPLFDALLTEKGSDLHLSAGYPPLGRIRGELTPLREAPLTASEVESLLFELLSPEQRRQLTEEQDLDFGYSYGTKARFRANCFHKVTGLAAVFRPLPGKVPSLPELGLPGAFTQAGPSGAPAWCSSLGARGYRPVPPRLAGECFPPH